jgi:hypothetical protein
MDEWAIVDLIGYLTQSTHLRCPFTPFDNAHLLMFMQNTFPITPC